MRRSILGVTAKDKGSWSLKRRNPLVQFVLFPSIGIATIASSTAALGDRFFEKNASQYCPADLSESEQSRVFSRILNLGASYSHGCTQCDTDDFFRRQVLQSGEFPYLRRNFLLQFMQKGNFKNKDEFKFEYFDVMENDFYTNYSIIFDQETLKRDGYSGKWSFFPDKDSTDLTTPGLEEYAFKSPGFFDAKPLVSTGFLRRNYKDRDLTRRGHVYQTVPGKFYEAGARQKYIFDLAIDKSRSFHIMKAYGDEAIFNYLLKTGWKDAEKREELKAKTVSYILSMQPSAIFAVDILFWDTVPLMFSYAQQQKPNSLIARIISAKFFSELLDLSWFDAVQRENMMEDFYDVLARISIGTNELEPVPVFLGRLIENPGQTIRTKGLQNEFAAVLGSFIELFTGRNFTAELVEQLKQMSNTGQKHLAFLELPFFGPMRQVVNSLARSQGSNKLLLSGNPNMPFLEKGYATNPFEHTTQPEREHSQALSAEDFLKISQAAKNAEEIIQNYNNRSIAQESFNENAAKPKANLPWMVRGAVNAAILNALGDLPLLIDSADKAFAHQNRLARLAARNPKNNIQLLNVDEFYENFPKLVNKYTMHPSVTGAKYMAEMLDRVLCSSVGPEP